MDVSQYQQLSFKDAVELILDAVSTQHPTMLLGPPGGGKTAMAIQLAQAIGFEYQCIELGLTVPEEIGGVPARDPATGTIVRFPLGPIKRAGEVPCVLHIDEVTRADATRQGAAMTGVNERRWGDYKLHPQTIVILSGNEPDSGGVFSILDALLNRCCVVRLRTTREETQAYLYQLGAEGSTLRTLAEDYAITSEARPALIHESPPDGFAESGALWASGRSIVNGLRRLAARVDKAGGNLDALKGPVALAHIAGCIGQETAIMWLTLRELREKLPTKNEIERSPKTAKLPSDTESAVASLALLAEVGKASPDAVWIYLGRYGDDLAEIRSVAFRRLQQYGVKLKDKEAVTAFNRLAATISVAMR